MNSPEEAQPKPERVRSPYGRHVWTTLILLLVQVIFIIAAQRLGDRSTSETFVSVGLLFSVFLVVNLSVFGYLHISSRSAAKKKYETLLRAIDKSKPSTRVRTATTTAIDAVAHRTHVNRTTASVFLSAALFLALLVNLRWNHVAPPALLVLLIAAITVLNGSTLALDYRVSHGLFGTNEQEAREIVRFVLKNAADSDFSGGLGARDLDLSAGTETALAAVWSGAPAYE
jgi:hypothetical protein